MCQEVEETGLLLLAAAREKTFQSFHYPVRGARSCINCHDFIIFSQKDNLFCTKISSLFVVFVNLFFFKNIFQFVKNSGLYQLKINYSITPLEDPIPAFEVCWFLSSDFSEKARYNMV